MNKLNKFDEFKTLVEPVCAWLRKNGNPHTNIIIGTDGAKVVIDVLGTPIPDKENWGVLWHTNGI